MYQIENEFVLRVPQKSYLNLLGENTFEEQDLKSLFSTGAFKESIFLASPSLYEELEKWLADELKNSKEVEKLKTSLFRYYARMSTRPTPYGLFAGCGLGEFCDETNISINHKKVSRHTRLDMNYLCALAQDLAKMPEIKPKLQFFPNTSIYTFGDKVRYVEFKYVNAKRLHHIVAVDDSEYLQRVLNAAKSGADVKTLAELLVEDEITFEDASGFIDELIDSQILVSSLEPAVTGDEFAEQIIRVLKRIPEAGFIVETLEEVQRKIADIDNGITAENIAKYYEIAKKLEQLETKYELKFLFQTDKFFVTENCEISNATKKDLQSAIGILNRISARGESQNLKKFREAFYERYETKIVPLLEALDTESGIGYLQDNTVGDITPLVDDLFMPTAESSKTLSANLNPIQQMLQRKLNGVKGAQEEIEITEDDLKDFKPKWDDLPHSISCMLSLAGKIKLNGEEKDLISVSTAGNTSAVNLLGRFCHGNNEVLKFSKSITQKEQVMEKNSILAEIVHLPESRTGNVLLRPTLRDFEIPFLAKSSVERENQITTDDIMVSVDTRKIYLWSKKLKKQIIPRMANAHNFSFNALPVYQFLCDVQHQGTKGLGFGWGDMKALYAHLPRVRYKNIVLAEALWRIKNEDIKKLMDAKDDEQILMAAAEFRKEFALPDYVSLVDSDNKLFVNLKNAWSIKSFLALVKRRSSFELEEFIFNPETSLVKDDRGAYTNELIVAFTKMEE